MGRRWLDGDFVCEAGDEEVVGAQDAFISCRAVDTVGPMRMRGHEEKRGGWRGRRLTSGPCSAGCWPGRHCVRVDGRLHRAMFRRDSQRSSVPAKKRLTRVRRIPAASTGNPTRPILKRFLKRQ